MKLSMSAGRTAAKALPQGTGGSKQCGPFAFNHEPAFLILPSHALPGLFPVSWLALRFLVSPALPRWFLAPCLFQFFLRGVKLPG